MAVSPYISSLRAVVGSRLLLVPTVSVWPRNDAGQILLVRSTDDELWGTIGGMVDVGESPDDAARREAQEEAGAEVNLTRIIDAVGGTAFEHHYVNGDHVANVAVIYEAEVIAGEPHPDGDETMDARWFHADELAALPLNTFAKSAFTHLGLLS